MLIPYANAVGGVVYWDDKSGLYVLESNSLSWQSIETRGCVLINTDYGMVVVIPVGIGQVSNLPFWKTVQEATLPVTTEDFKLYHIKKGSHRERFGRK